MAFGPKPKPKPKPKPTLNPEQATLPTPPANVKAPEPTASQPNETNKGKPSTPSTPKNTVEASVNDEVETTDIRPKDSDEETLPLAPPGDPQPKPESTQDKAKDPKEAETEAEADEADEADEVGDQAVDEADGEEDIKAAGEAEVNPTSARAMVKDLEIEEEALEANHLRSLSTGRQESPARCMERLQNKCARAVSMLTQDLEEVVTELLWTKEQLISERERKQQLDWQVTALKDDLMHVNKELRKTTLSYQSALRDKSQQIDHNHQLHVFLSKHNLDTIAQAEALLSDLTLAKDKALEDMRYLSNEVKVVAEQRQQLQRENSDLRKEGADYKQQSLKQQMELALSLEEGKRQAKRITSLQHQLQLFRRKTTTHAVGTTFKAAVALEQHKATARLHPIGGRSVPASRPSSQAHALHRLHKKLQRLQRHGSSPLGRRSARR